MWDEITPDAQAAHTREQLSRPVDLSAPAPGVFHNLAGGAGTYFMRSMAEAGRGLDLLGSVIPIAHDAIIGGTSNQEQYFKEHDDVFGRAVDYWTPKPGEVGAAGEVLGSVSGNLLQFATNPVLALNTAQMGTSEDLAKQGVNAPAAVGAGTLASLGLVAGIKIPIAGKTLAQRVATGVAGNVGQGVAQAAATHTLLQAAGAPDQVAAQFDPWDLKARTIDTLMGAAFGVAAHIGAPKQDLTQQQKDALMLVNQARHLEEASSPGRPATEADLTKTVAATREAIDQMLRGEPVEVADVAPVPRVPAVETPEFKAWFGDSKMVDEQGKPLVVYHGTSADVQAFDPGQLQAEGIHLTSDSSVANRYAASRSMDGGRGANVIPLYVKADRVLDVPMISTEVIKNAAASGFDAVRRGDHIVVMRQEQIKSAIGNTGRFDPESGSLTDSPFATWAEQIRAAIDEMRAAAEKEAQHAEMAKVIDEALPKSAKPIEAPKMLDAVEPPPEAPGQVKPQDGAAPAPQFPDTVRLPSGEFDPKTGEPTTVSANDYIAKAHAELADAKARGAELFRAAAGCLLGSL